MLVLFALLQCVVLGCVPLTPTLVHIEPAPQAVDVVTERRERCSFAFPQSLRCPLLLSLDQRLVRG